ncbi:fibronectin type III domain-containing protein [Paenibacillus sp. HJGM_3]|uniref:fibronectin type III domain-containing protein n=1 Tax=Paenibacillus sp. HJGM_3 TaxID=3379816 RepID=UPI00385E8E1D
MKRLAGRKKLLLVLVLGLMLGMMPVHVFAYDSTATWKTRIDAAIATMDTASYYYGYTDTPRSELLAWNGSYTLDALLRMYQLTKDTQYIQKTSAYIDHMYDNLGDVNGDGYLGWGTEYYTPGTYTEYVVHYGMILVQWAKFILTVKADSTLAASLNPQGITYASQVASLESVIDNHLVARWNKDWSVVYNTYLDEYNSNKSLPHNQYLALANALYLLYQANTANKHYLLWADQMCGKWKSYVVANGTAYKWNYHDVMIPADDNSPALEDWSHAAVDIQNAILNYNRGGSWTGPEMTKLGNTIYSVMYDGNASDPGLYHNVGGTGAADGEITGAHLDLDRWVSGIWTRGEKHRSLNWGGAAARPLMDAAKILQLHPSNAAPESFALSSPVDGATGRDTTTAFTWQPSKNASDYTLQISTSSSFSTYTVNRPSITETSASVQSLAPNTTYYWRVIARNKAGTTITSETRSFTTKPAPTFTLTFKHSDTRASGSPAGFLYKQVLVDDVVVWEQDVTADAASTWLTSSVNITAQSGSKSSVNIKFRLYNKGNISNYSASAYFDDVALTNADVVNGGFEKSELWSYLESGTAFTGGYDSTVVSSGAKSYRLSIPSNTASSAGHYGAVQNRWALMQ